MATASYTSDLVDIFLFEVTTGVSAYGGGASGLGASPDYSIEGTNAVDKQIDNSEKGFLYNSGSAFSIGPHDHFFIWVIVGVPGLTNTRNNRGIVVCIGDSTTAFVKFHVNGKDTLPRGGHNPYAIRFSNTAFTNRKTLVGSPGTTPSQIGCGAFTTGTAKFSNLGADAARKGTGYTILGGTGADPEATFAGIAADDTSTAEGICQPASGGYSIQGKIRIGRSGTECEFLDLNTNIFLTANLDTHTLEDFTEFILSDDLSIWTLTNVNFITLGTFNRGRLEMVTPLITGQTHTSYDNSPTSEGTFSGGTGHAVSDVITLSDGWTTVTVNAVSGGVVTQFTVSSLNGRSAVAGTAMTQQSTTGSGTGFSLTPDTDNIVTAPDLAFTNVGFIDFGETVFQSTAQLLGCRWVGCKRIVANGAVFTDSAVTNFHGQPLINAQDETSYDNSPTTEGTFSGGSGYAASDTITLSDGSVLTVDAVSAGVVTQFTVANGRAAKQNVALTQVHTSGSGTGFTLTPDVDNLVEAAAMVWDVNSDPDGELDGMTFTKGDNPSHAIEFGLNSPTTMTLTGVTFSGYGSTGNKDAAIWIRRTTGTVTLNITGGTTPTYKSDGATVTIVSGSVTITVNVKTTGGSNISGARVIMAATSGGPFPVDASVSISNSGTTATVTHTAHGLATNDKVMINGASHWQNNGPFSITVTGANTYTYVMPSAPGSSPTGTITSTFLCLYDVTDASGNVTTSRVYSSSQPFSGRARKSSTAPYYKTGPFSGSVSNVTGFSANVQLVADE